MRAIYLVPIQTNMDAYAEQITAPEDASVGGYGWNIRFIPGEMEYALLTVTSSEGVLLALPWPRVGSLVKVSGVGDTALMDKALALSKTWDRDKAGVLAALIKAPKDVVE